MKGQGDFPSLVISWRGRQDDLDYQNLPAATVSSPLLLVPVSLENFTLSLPVVRLLSVLVKTC